MAERYSPQVKRDINEDKYDLGTSNYDLFKNRNIDYLDGPFTKVIYVIFLFLVWSFLHLSMGNVPEDVWMATNIIHGVVTFIFFHWIKGCPDDSNQGDYSHLTLYEQIDGGISWTFTKKFLMLMPTLICWLSCHIANYKKIYVLVNVGIFVICIIAKIPAMHRVRIFGINSSIGIDSPVEVSERTANTSTASNTTARGRSKNAKYTAKMNLGSDVDSSRSTNAATSTLKAKSPARKRSVTPKSTKKIKQ